MRYCTQRQQSGPARNAFTLIEIILAATIVSVVLSSVAVALHVMFQVDGQLREDLAYSVLLPRLSIQVRQDAHEAYSVETTRSEDELSVLTLKLTDRRVVRYEANGSRIVRIVHRDEEKLRHEVYALGAAVVRWEFDEETRLLQLRIEHNVGEIEGAQDSLRVDLVEAVAGLNTSAFETDTDAADAGSEEMVRD